MTHLAVRSGVEPVATTAGTRYDFTVYDEGYDFIPIAERYGFSAVSSWGLDGWDLGDWPYVIFFRSYDGRFVLEYVEGDLYFREYATPAGASAFLDSQLLAWNRYASDAVREHFGHIDGAGGIPATVDGLPDRFRGAFSWHRSNRARGEACRSECKRCAS